jgi:hypothetical protein
MECKSKNGFFKKQSVTVYGEDAVETVMDTVAAGSQLVEVIPVFGEWRRSIMYGGYGVML